MTTKTLSPLHQAVLHEQAGRATSAEKAYKKAIAAAPKDEDGYRLLSEFYRRRGKFDQAETTLTRGISRTGGSEGLRVDLGTFYQQTGQIEQAKEAYGSVLTENPDNAAALVNFSGLCLNIGEYVEGLALAEKACEIAAGHPAPHSNRGNLLAALGRFDDADAAFDTALSLDPNYPDAMANRANHLKNSGRIDQAVNAYRQGVEKHPNDPRFAFGLSLSSLGTGDLQTGWGYYEAGFATGDRIPDRRQSAPDWFGQDLTGKSLLVWPEQGLGDELLFASCLNDLRKALPQTRIIVECDPRLLPAYQRSFPDLICIPEEGIIVGSIEAQTPIGRLPGLFRPIVDSFSPSGGYLTADPERGEEMRNRLSALPAGKKIGINWRSGLVTQKREHGLTELDDWLPLLSAPGIVAVNLQYGDCEDELQAFESKHNIQVHRWADLDLRDDLESVFALISELDAVVNVGTSVMGMAGALGTPQHILFREQEWITLGTGGMPWYANATVHERKVSDTWQVALESVRSALTD